jgi:hypothetical protein
MTWHLNGRNLDDTDSWPAASPWQGPRLREFHVGDKIDLTFDGKSRTMIIQSVNETTPGTFEVKLRHADTESA